MKSLCVTSFRKHHVSDAKVWSDSCSILPRLSLCVVGDSVSSQVVDSIRNAVQADVVLMNGQRLIEMVRAVNTPWWMLLYDNEFLSYGLLDALPVLLAPAAWEEFDGYTLFRRNVEGTAYSYHTRILNSRVGYNAELRRPVGSGRYERILNGWVVYDTHNNTDERRSIP